MSPYDSEAMLRYVTAKGYIQSCKIILYSEHYEKNQTLTLLPMHMLAGFSIELYFKAWILGAGGESAKVKKYGHDIFSLFSDVKNIGLPYINGIDALVEQFSGSHSDFTYRYIESGAVVRDTHWPIALKVFDDLDTKVDTFLGASAQFGLQPGH